MAPGRPPLRSHHPPPRLRSNPLGPLEQPRLNSGAPHRCGGQPRRGGGRAGESPLNSPPEGEMPRRGREGARRHSCEGRNLAPPPTGVGGSPEGAGGLSAPTRPPTDPEGPKPQNPACSTGVGGSPEGAGGGLTPEGQKGRSAKQRRKPRLLEVAVVREQQALRPRSGALPQVRTKAGHEIEHFDDHQLGRNNCIDGLRPAAARAPGSRSSSSAIQ